MLRLPLQPVFWECPNTNGETDHQGPVFIHTYKQPQSLAFTQEGNIIQRMKVCLEWRITLYSRLSPSCPHPEQTGLRGAFPSLTSAWGRGYLWHLLSFLRTLFFCRSSIQHLWGRKSSLLLHLPSGRELVLGRIFGSANLMCFSLACITTVLRSNASSWPVAVIRVMGSKQVGCGYPCCWDITASLYPNASGAAHCVFFFFFASSCPSDQALNPEFSWGWGPGLVLFP